MRDLARIKRRFVDAASKNDRYFQQGAYWRANRAANTVQKVCRQMKRHGNGGRNVLVSLMHHEHPAVRLAAAAVCRSFAEDDAVAVLKDLAKGSGHIALTATLILDEYHKGWRE